MKIGSLTDEARLDSAPLTLAADLFAGKTALVSGAGGGIGKAIAWALARLGANIVTCGRSNDKMWLLREAFDARDWPIFATAADIRDEAQVDALFNAAVSRYGPLDIVINNAGGQFAQAALDLTPKGWRAVIDTNLTGTWLMMQAAAQRWKTGAGGTIVNITAANSRGMPGIAHTSAARAAIENATKTAAVEWAPLGIRINCLALGLVDSAGLGVYPQAAQAGFARANPQRAKGDPWDVAQFVGFLASDAAKFITGQSFTMDGGGALWGDLWTIERPAYFDDFVEGGPQK